MRFPSKLQGSTGLRLPWYYENSEECCKTNSAQKNKKTENEPISIGRMTFFKPLGPNYAVITMVLGRACREQNPPHPQQFM